MITCSQRLLGFIFLFLGMHSAVLAQEDINLEWKPREDLNISLPSSVRIYEANGFLSDSAHVRVVYATVDLNDENLNLRAIGSNTERNTTEETYLENDGILAINGGYFSNNASVSMLISDGKLISAGTVKNKPRGGFALIDGNPKIIWTQPNENSEVPVKYESINQTTTLPLEADQAVGGGPVLMKNGKIEVTSVQEGFRGSHLQRHPRTAIGYANQNQLIMMVVDGRQQTSSGVTLPELAQLMKSAGAVEAVNLDGGGSSAMVAADEVVNIPADIPNGNRNSLRHNASALVLSEKVPSEEKEAYYFDTEGSDYSENGLWKSSNRPNYHGKSPSRTTSAKLDYNKAVYQFHGIPQKKYQLGVWWTVDTTNNTSQTTYTLHQGNKSKSIVANQNALDSSGKWNVLGDFLLGPDDYLEITGAGKEGKITTDAMRLVPVKQTSRLANRGDLRIAVISDLNAGLGATDYEWQVDSIINRIPRIWKPDLVICGGDMVAGMGVSDSLQLKKMWAAFDKKVIQPLKEANIPFAFTLGNHDGPRSYPIEQQMAREYWNTPEHIPNLEFVDKQHFPNYYSFLIDNVFVVSWEASSPVITKENLEWMKEQFSRPEAKQAQFRMVMGHMPLYSVAQERDNKGDVLENPEELQKLLEDYNVHTYISGHQHAFYPGKHGKLELLSAGAAGSGPRSWLTLEHKPENTITLMDIYNNTGKIEYTTYKIKEANAEDMQVFDETMLPSSVFGVNGYVIRRDIPLSDKAFGKFSAINALQTYGNSSEVIKNNEEGSGSVTAEFLGDNLLISGHYFNLSGKLLQTKKSEQDSLVTPGAIALFQGRNTEKGRFLTNLKIKSHVPGIGTFQGSVKQSEELREWLSVGALYVALKTSKGVLRTQLYPKENQMPDLPKITSHNSRNVYGVRDLEAIYEIEWENAYDKEGDFVSFTYQLAKDPAFKHIIFQENTGRTALLKKTEQDWFKLLGKASEGKPVIFYHRVMASDGKNISRSPSQVFKLMKTAEPLDDFIEVPAPNYELSGKIAPGGGYGAEWDANGNLWLADYGGKLIIQDENGEELPFSPLTSVTVAGEIYNLKPLNGIGVDLDGNILVGKSRNLLKIDAKTGKGIAAWEVPEGERAITSPRARNNGEIYAMSLFGEDPNYVLRQSEEDPSQFELVRTVELKKRILSRTFAMSQDGKTLYFPDPGSPLIQKYSSDDGLTYSREKDIISTAAGSSGVQITADGSLFSAVRASGISPATFHFRSEKDQKMWTLELPNFPASQPRGIGVSPDHKILIFCNWDQGGGFYKYDLKP